MTSRSPGRSFWRRFAHQTEVGAECAWFTAPIPSKTPLTAHPELSFLGKKMGDQLWQRRVCLRLCPQEGSQFFSSTWWGKIHPLLWNTRFA